jgi:hypothetical protein
MRHLFLFLILSVPGICKSQTVSVKDQYLVTGLSQISESMNYGFVFSGPMIKYGREWQWLLPDDRIGLESSIGLSAVFKKGPGIDFTLTPLNLNYLFKLSDQLWLGPDVMTGYNYEFYPDRQTGHGFWFSHYSAGFAIFFQKVLSERIIWMKISSSLFGFTSRTPENFNTLFFNIGFKDAIQDLHSDMNFSQFGRYNVTHFEISLKPVQSRRISFSYLMDYAGFYKAPHWTRLDYAIKLSIQSRK